MKLKGKVGIVTGAAQGIGQAIAEVMAREGAAVMVSDVNEAGARKVAEGIIKSGGKALAVTADISKADQVSQMVERTLAGFGRVDILVNNAAFNQLSHNSFANTDEAEWRQHIDITLVGTLHCCKAVVGHMLKQKSGRIINITSDAGKIGIPYSPLYSATKAAVSGFSRALAVDLAPQGITVNCVSPGPILTPKMVETLEKKHAGEDMYASRIPMRRVGKPEDIAYMVVFLASDEASFITGQDYSVDGGARM
ncbi:MAG: 3-oxoacyl-ACP reductase FabG [Dehalococcoidia bacterium]|nr:3-oxoacyl-ACP reductase FabG [Dehalococcoidia bacterium]